MKLPKARTSNLIEQNFETETLIYDLNINKAFNLNETSTIIYKACNGESSFEDLKRRYKFTDELIFLALDELRRNDLLAKDESFSLDALKTNRRELIKKVGLTTMFALPVITGLLAPRAVNAASDGLGTDRQIGETCVNRNNCIIFATDINGNLVPVDCLNGTCCSAYTPYTKGQSFSDNFVTQAEPPTTCEGYDSRCCASRATGTCTSIDLCADGENCAPGSYYSVSCNCTCS